MPDTDPLRGLPEPQHLRLVDDGPTIEIALVCATGDAAALAEVAERRGLGAVRIVAGVERDADVLRTAITQCSTPTLFVLCRTPALDHAQARRAVECFGGRRVVNHRLLVAQFEPHRPAGWVGAVQRAAGSMYEAQAVLGAYARAETMVDSTLGDVARGETRVRRATPPRPTAPRQPVLVDRPTRAGEAITTWRDEVGPIPAHVRAPGQRREHLAVVDPRDTADDGPASISDAVLVLDPPGVAPVVAAPTRVHQGPIGEPAAARGVRPAAIGLVTLVVVGFAVAPMLRAGHGEVAPTPTIATAIAPAVVPEASAAPPPGAEIVAAPPVFTPPPSPSLAAVPPLQQAVDEGRVGRLEGLYVVTASTREVDWYTAANTCRGRVVDGTRGFRLPTIDELRWLRRRDLVPAERALWSGTRVFGRGRRNWVLTPSGGSSTQDKRDELAFVVCVRGH